MAPAFRFALVAAFAAALTVAQVPTEHHAVSVLTPNNATTLCAQNVAQDPTRALDLSGGVTAGTYYLSLCGLDSVAYGLGVTVIDGPGPDLQVEEVNPNLLETYRVEVSPDGTTWFQVPGPYTGSTWAGDAALDLAGLGVTTVNYVKIIDASGTTTGTTPGPDFDAIVAINYVPPTFGGVARPYADLALAYNQGVTTTSPYLDPTRALGPPDAYRSESYVGPTSTTFSGNYYNFVSLGQGATIVLGFSSDWIADGPGGDLLVHEYYSPEGNLFTVEASDDGVHWFPMTLVGNVSSAYGTGQPVTNNVQSFDLAGTGLVLADFVRIVSTATSGAGTTPGAELDALEGVNFIPKARRLTVGTPLTAGGIGTIALSAPTHLGDLAAILPAVTPPVAPGAGIPLAAGVEYRLDLADPILNFVLFDPLAPLLVAGAIGPLSGTGQATVSVTLPFDPALQGVVLYWHAGLFTPVPGVWSGVSNILASRVQ